MLVCGISVFLYLFFDAEQFHFKRLAHVEIELSEHLETIKLPVSEFAKNKDKDEVWVDSRLYDVKSYVIINDTVLLSVYHDDKEEGLVKTIVAHIEGGNKFAAANGSRISKVHLLSFNDGKIMSTPFSIERLVSSSVFHPFSHIDFHFVLVYNDVVKPPPNGVVA